MKIEISGEVGADAVGDAMMEFMGLGEDAGWKF